MCSHFYYHFVIVIVTSTTTTSGNATSCDHQMRNKVMVSSILRSSLIASASCSLVPPQNSFRLRRSTAKNKRKKVKFSQFGETFCCLGRRLSKYFDRTARFVDTNRDTNNASKTMKAVPTGEEKTKWKKNRKIVCLLHNKRKNVGLSISSDRKINS